MLPLKFWFCLDPNWGITEIRLLATANWFTIAMVNSNKIHRRTGDVPNNCTEPEAMYARWPTRLGRQCLLYNSRIREAEDRWSDGATTTWTVAAVALLLVLAPVPAWAYMDPTASGLLYQILMPLYVLSVVGLTVLRKGIARTVSNLLAWARTGLLRRRPRADDRAKS